MNSSASKHLIERLKSLNIDPPFCEPPPWVVKDFDSFDDIWKETSHES